MMRRWLSLVVVSASACTALQEPGGEIGSISALELPSPSVVIGDVMRDSTGVPAPARVQVFDRRGNPIQGASVEFLSLDPSVAISPTGEVTGVAIDTAGARVVGGVAGLQTTPVRVFVTIAPTRADTTRGGGSILFTPLTDTTNQSNWSDTLGVRVTGAGGGGAQGFIVSFSILRSVTPVGSTPSVYLAESATGRASSRDTTNASGYASRRLILRQSAVGDAALLGGGKTDTVVVRASVRYRGAEIAGAPFTFQVPVRRR